jgi:hypothetical protein
MQRSGSHRSDDDGANADAIDLISEEQYEALRSLIVEVGADLPKFLRFMKVESLDQISAANFEKAKAALESKRTR